jgi:hypothetical protein
MPINLPDLNLGLKQVNTGNNTNDGLGDNARDAFGKFNFNMAVLAGSVNQALTQSQEYFVSNTGSDSNDGLTAQTAFQTISKAIRTIYSGLNLRGQQVYISLMPGDYVEPVIINTLPVGAYGNNLPIIIRKATGQAGTVYWTLDTASSNCLLSLQGAARVMIDGITIRSGNPQDNTRFIEVRQGSILGVGSVTFSTIANGNPVDGNHILVDSSEVQLLKPYTITGGGTSHIKARNDSLVWSPVVNGDPKLCSVSGSVAFAQFVWAQLGSTITLDDALIRYSGNLQGLKFRSDILSYPTIGNSALPNTTTAGAYDPYTFLASTTFTPAATFTAGFTSNGTTTFNGTTNFTSQVQFTNAGSVTFAGATNFTGLVTVPTVAQSDISNKAASTAYVQTAVQNSLVNSLPIATPNLFGIVKINIPDNNPIVYTQASVDSLLQAKANLASPNFTGTPTVPTGATNLNNTQAASTAFVKNAIAAVPIIRFGSTGSEGVYNQTSGTQSIFGVEHRYTSFNLSAGAVLNCSQPLWLKVTGDVTIAGTINMAPCVKGGQRHRGFYTTGYYTGYNGSGFGASSGVNDAPPAIYTYLASPIGSGGSGGHLAVGSYAFSQGNPMLWDSATIAACSGGNGGSFIVIEATGTITITGTINASGQDGGDVSNATGADGGAIVGSPSFGGGGGGSGGLVWLRALTAINLSGTAQINVKGGAGGQGYFNSGGVNIACSAGGGGGGFFVCEATAVNLSSASIFMDGGTSTYPVIGQGGVCGASFAGQGGSPGQAGSIGQMVIRVGYPI